MTRPIAVLLFTVGFALGSATRLTAQQPELGLGPSLTPYLVAISVANVDTSYAWYRGHLGFQPLRAPYAPVPGIRIGVLIQGDFRLELIEAAGARRRQSALPDSTRDVSLRGFVKLAFRVPNVDSAVAAFRRAGIPIRFGPVSDANFHVRHFLVADPDGNVLQFFQPLAP